jgi:hypothetical protein
MLIKAAKEEQFKRINQDLNAVSDYYDLYEESKDYTFYIQWSPIHKTCNLGYLFH